MIDRVIKKIRHIRLSGQMVRRLLFAAGLIVCIFLGHFLVRGFGERMVVQGSGMAPVYEDQDQVRINKVVYHLSKPKRFDAVAVSLSSSGTGTYYVRRIIGVPKDTIVIKGGQIYVNEEVLENPYNDESIASAGSASSMIILEDDEYFVLCDNYNADSSDSRLTTIGLIKKDQIAGRVR